MLQKLTLHNFQAHEKTVVEFDPCVTVIVGPTDAGKSAIIRALRWVAQNRPSGQEFRRHNTERTAVTLRVDGHKIKRVRTKAENSYEVDGAKAKAFGAQVPDEVLKLLRMDDLNFQAQHDSPFWFSETPGTVSRLLNNIVDLGAIDHSLGAVGASLRKARATRDVCSVRVTEARAAKKESAFAQELDADLQELEALSLRKTNTGLRWAALKLLLDKLIKVREESRTSVPVLVELQEYVERLERAQERIKGLRHLLAEMAYADLETAAARADWDVAHKRFHNSTKGTRCPLCNHMM